MALQVIEGFDHMSSTDLMDSKNWTLDRQLSAGEEWGVGFTTGRHVGYSFYCTQPDNQTPYMNMWRLLPSTYSHFVCGFAFQVSDMPRVDAGGRIFSFWTDAGSQILRVVTYGDGSIALRDSSDADIARSSAGVFTARAWHFLELKVLINGASSTVEAYLNGVSIIGSSTVNLGSTAVQFIGPYTQANNGWRGNSNLTSTMTIYWDDIYFADTTAGVVADFIGDVRVETIFPNADGTHSDWTPNSGGNHYSRVNEHTVAPYPDDDTTYLSTSTVGNKDTWNYDNLTIVTGTIYGVQTNMYARKEDPLLRQVESIVISGATETVSATPHTLAVSYVDGVDMYEKNPSTAAQWTVSQVNAAEFGVKLAT